jgi:hypothetical protein
MLEALNRHAEAQGKGFRERDQERQRNSLRLAAAIEAGETLQFRSGQLHVLPRQVAPQPAIHRERGKEPDRDPPERVR